MAIYCGGARILICLMWGSQDLKPPSVGGSISACYLGEGFSSPLITPFSMNYISDTFLACGSSAWSCLQCAV